MTDNMGVSKAEALLHPVRLRIVQALLSGEPKTAGQLARILGDVPQASLYRHIKRLVETDFLHVIEERPVGGAVERVYTVNKETTVLTGTDLASVTPEEHLRYFTNFCLMLIGKFGRYLEQDRIDLEADLVGYRTLTLHLTDDELQQLLTEMKRPVLAVRDNKPAPGRRPRLFATVIMPDDTHEDDAREDDMSVVHT